MLEINDVKFVSTIFLRPKDVHMEMWDGAVTGLAEPDYFGVNQATNISDLSNYLELLNRIKILERCHNYYLKLYFFFYYFFRTIKSTRPDTIWYNSEESEYPIVSSKILDIVKTI